MSKTGFIAVTGGTGVVGHHVIRALLTEGYNVKALARSPSKLSDITDDKLTVIQGNLKAVDASFLKGASTVLHMAGLIKAQTREDIMLVNRDGAGAVASAAQEVGVPRFVLMSSQTAGQPQLSDYAASKYAGEIAVKEAYQGTLAIIRAPAVIGPRDEATKPFFDFIQKGKLPVAGGKGWKTESFYEALEAHPFREDILLTGFVDKRHLIELYTHATALVYPSLYEGFGFPILEALSCGSRVICSNNSSLPEVGGDLALYFPPEDEAALLEQMKVALVEGTDDEFRQRALQHAHTFSWEKHAFQFMETIQNAFQKNQPKATSSEIS